MAQYYPVATEALLFVVLCLAAVGGLAQRQQQEASKIAFSDVPVVKKNALPVLLLRDQLNPRLAPYYEMGVDKEIINSDDNSTRAFPRYSEDTQVTSLASAAYSGQMQRRVMGVTQREKYRNRAVQQREGTFARHFYDIISSFPNPPSRALEARV
jgi:hypothetical protein